MEASAPFKINIDVDRNEFKYNYEADSTFQDPNQDILIDTFKSQVLEEVSKLKNKYQENEQNE